MDKNADLIDKIFLKGRVSGAAIISAVDWETLGHMTWKLVEIKAK